MYGADERARLLNSPWQMSLMCKSYFIGRRVNAWSRTFSVLCVGFEAALGAIPRRDSQGVVVVVEKDILEAHRCAGRLDRR